MRSSTSHSKEKPRSRRGTIASGFFVCMAILYYAGIEWQARLYDAHVASIERRYEDYNDALDFGKRPDSSMRMLVLGNSLLLHGVRFDELKDALSPRIDAKQYLILNTTYFDWYYTLVKMFNSGARPEIVVLVLSPRQFVSWNVREDYFARHLMRARDIFAVARDLKLSNTQASNLAFSRLSQFFDSRAQIRNEAVKAIFPNLGPLMSLMTRVRNAPPIGGDGDRVESVAAERLRSLRELAAQWNTKIILVIPPSDGGRGNSAAYAIQSAGSAAGVPVLVPVAPGSFKADHYVDGFHLNKLGAETFTPRLIAALQKETAIYTTRKASQVAGRK